MPEGVPASVTLEAARKIEVASQIVNEEMSEELGLSEPMIRHTLVSVGTKSERSGPGSPLTDGQATFRKSLSILPQSVNEAIFLQKQSPIAGERPWEAFRTRLN